MSKALHSLHCSSCGDVVRRSDVAICVQFARSADGGYEQYAIKFFLQLEDYRREQALYRDDAIRRTLPALLQASDNTTDTLVSQSGLAFPPYLVR